MQKMIMVILNESDGEILLDMLAKKGLTATFMESKGGVLRERQFTLFIAIPEEKIIEIMDMIDLINKDKEPSRNDSSVKELLNDSGFSSGGKVKYFIWDIH